MYTATAPHTTSNSTTATIQPVRQKTFDSVRFLMIAGKSPGLARTTPINTAIASISFGNFSIMATMIDLGAFKGAIF
jgi:hypothetical protein